uniref:ATP synthase F0 subunit 8 n=1 Tax=Carinata dushanensis TaxID=3040693 RepID=UPI00255209C7|nr:ATP synthase F0 subunit 8 [Carinata dushanensis]WGC89407.1 ATP synthase F0 subunit 8 [Carinata dushanensis]
MPQMSPMWWMYMLFMFSLCLMLMNSMVYFNYMFNNTNFKSFKLKNLNWKW